MPDKPAHVAAPTTTTITPQVTVLGTDLTTATIAEDLLDFDDQCFLLEYALQTYKTIASKPPPEGTPTAIVRDLTQLKTSATNTNIDYVTSITIESEETTFKKFFELTPAETGQMVPLIQISVDRYTKGGGKTGRTYFEFANQTDFLSTKLQAFQSTGKRNLAGIKNISVNLDGVDAATSKLVTINASFVFQDFRAIFDPLPDITVNGIKVRRTYTDLFSYSIKSLNSASIYKKLNFTIGWGANDTLKKKLGLNSKKLSLDAQITKYNFDFREDGSVAANITYKGLIESMLDGPESNILSLVKRDIADMHVAKVAQLEQEADDLIAQNQKQVKDTLLHQIALNLWTARFNEMLQGRISGVEPPKWNYLGGTGGQGRYATGGWRWAEHAPSMDKAGQGPHGYAKSEYLNDAFTDPTRSDAHMGPGRAFIGLGLEHDTLLQWIKTQHAEIYNNLGTGDDVHTIINKMQRQYGLMLGHGTTQVGAKEKRNVTYSEGLSLDFLNQSWLGNVGGGTAGGVSGQIAWEEMTAAEFKDYKNVILAGKRKQNLGNKEQLDKNIQEAAANAMKSILKQLSLVKFSGLRMLTTQLLANQRVYFAKLTGDDKMNLQQNLILPKGIKEVFTHPTKGLYQKWPKILSLQPQGWALGKHTADGTSTGATTAAAVVTYQELMKGRYQLIPFVFLGDFLASILDLPTRRSVATSGGEKVSDLITKQYGQKFKIDLGYMHYQGPFTGGAIEKLPLYYLPLSLKKINNFFARDIIGKERTFFSFKQFVVAILQQFLLGAYNTCRRSTMSSIGALPKLDFVHGTVGKGSNKFKTWFIYGTQNTSQEIPRSGWGKYSENMSRKISHFYLGGQNKGILQSIKIIDNTNPDLKVVTYMKTKTANLQDVDGSDQGLLPPLIYKVEIKTLGCTTFHMGQLLFLDAQQFVDAKTNRIFQITGYYRIYKVAHTTGREGFSTTLTAILEESRKDFKLRGKTGATGASATGGQSIEIKSGPGTLINTAEGAEAMNEKLSKIADAAHAAMGQTLAPTRARDSYLKHLDFMRLYVKARDAGAGGLQTEHTLATTAENTGLGTTVFAFGDKRGALLSTWVNAPSSFAAANFTIPALMGIILNPLEACYVKYEAANGIFTLLKQVLAATDVLKAPAEATWIYATEDWGTAEGASKYPEALLPDQVFLSDSTIGRTIADLAQKLPQMLQIVLNKSGNAKCHGKNREFQTKAYQTLKRIANILCEYITWKVPSTAGVIKGPYGGARYGKCPLYGPKHFEPGAG
jgi:hypothetical protein